ncbi:MAG: deaminase domain-containing protein [Clostridia bacterium]|nr:deaminase domain-containing protein [Clostridia bacterium]
MDFAEWKESLSDEQKQAFDLHVRQNRNKSSDKKQYEKYKSRLGADNLPKIFDKFQDLKYNDVSKWNELKYAYRTVNRYEIEGVVPIEKIIELDRAAWYTKQTGFDYSNLTGKDRKEIKGMPDSGNCAAMDFNGKIYFSHSRVGGETSVGYKSYVGSYPLVGLTDKRRFSVKDLGDGVPRENDTEAKFLEFVATQKKSNDTFAVTILSEKHICPSCEGVVEQFKEMFPNAIVNIISGRRGYNDSEKGLLTYKHRKKVKKDG